MRTRARPASRLVGLIALGIAASSPGCGDDPGPPPDLTGDSVPLPGPGCEIDPSVSEETAYPLTLTPGGDATQLGEEICPRLDIDYWTFEISDARQIVSVDLVADDLIDARFAARLIGPGGLCVPSPAIACTHSTDCLDIGGVDGFCDVVRGVCRVGAQRTCYVDGDCEGTESCNVVRQNVATAYEDTVGGVRHRVLTSLPAFIPGTYFLAFFDQAGNADSTAYSVEVSQRQDPDPGEPNDAQHLATPLTSGTQVSAAFSYVDDVDWYVIEPGIGTPPVVSIDLRWPRGTDAVPTWTLYQGGDEWLASRQALVVGTDMEQQTRYVLPSTETIFIEVRNPSRAVDADSPYQLTVSIEEDGDELADRNDRPSDAIGIDASGLGTVHQSPVGGHTVIAENDDDWFRVDRVGATENSLLYLRATASPTAPYLLQVLFFLPNGATCDAATETQCSNGELCVCPKDSCVAGEGACIEPWSQLPVPQDPGGDEQSGGRSPNHLETQVPLFAAGEGALFFRIGHIRSTDVAGLDGYSTAEAYQLEVIHRQELDPQDLNAPVSHYLPRPFALEPYEVFAVAELETLGGAESGTPSAPRFVALAAGSQALIDPLVDSCVTLTLEAYDDRGVAAAAGNNETVTVELIGATAGTLVDDCTALPPTALAGPVTVTGPNGTVGLQVLAGTSGTLPEDVTLRTSGAGLATVDSALTVTDALLDGFTFTERPGGFGTVPAPATRFFVTNSPSPPIRASLPQAAAADTIVDVAVAQSPDARVGSADFGPSAPYCVCDVDCLDICNCAGDGCDDCACDPDPSCSADRGCTCDPTPDAFCPGIAAPPFDLLSPPCVGTLFGATAQSACQLLIAAGDDFTEVDVARTTPGVVTLTLRAAGYASTSWSMVVDDPRVFQQNPTDGVTLSASGIISYAGDQDWFYLPLPADLGTASVHLQTEYAASPVDIRYRVFRGTNPGNDAAATGVGRSTFSDICDLPDESCMVGGTCDTTRNTCDHDAFGTPGAPEEIDPASDCTYIASSDSRLYIWVNDVDFNDWAETLPYSFRVDLIEGCTSQCSPFLCAR